MTDLVISAYKASLGWVNELTVAPDRLFVYNKGERAMSHDDFRCPCTTVQNLPNCGKIDHTLAHHCVEHYDDLADWTVFSPDHPFDHLGGGAFEGVLVPAPSTVCPFRSLDPYGRPIQDWGADGRIAWETFVNRPDGNGTNWFARYRIGKVKRARLSFVAWAKQYAGVDIVELDSGRLGRGWLGYHPGAIYGVPRAGIRQHPRAFYAAIREQLSHHAEPEEGHYCERLWLEIFKYDGNTKAIATKG